MNRKYDRFPLPMGAFVLAFGVLDTRRCRVSDGRGRSVPEAARGAQHHRGGKGTGLVCEGIDWDLPALSTQPGVS